MTPAELANVVALPLSGVAWMGVQELTPAQLSAILAALASAGRTNHLQTGGANPTATYQAGDGGAITSIVGTDSAGRIQITSGTGSVAPTALADITMAAAFTTLPSVVITPADDATQALGAYAAPDQMNFALWHLGVHVLPAGQTYTWFYAVVGAPN